MNAVDQMTLGTVFSMNTAHATCDVVLESGGILYNVGIMNAQGGTFRTILTQCLILLEPKFCCCKYAISGMCRGPCLFRQAQPQLRPVARHIHRPARTIPTPMARLLTARPMTILKAV